MSSEAFRPVPLPQQKVFSPDRVFRISKKLLTTFLGARNRGSSSMPHTARNVTGIVAR